MPYDTRPRPRDADKMARESIAEGERLGICQPVHGVSEDDDPNCVPRDKDIRIKDTRADDRTGYVPFKVTR